MRDRAGGSGHRKTQASAVCLGTGRSAAVDDRTTSLGGDGDGKVGRRGDGADDAHQHALLTTPTGAPGSGRLRYGAAMYFHARGDMADGALEVYRVLSATDADDPDALLRARGFDAGVPKPLPNAAACLSRLIGEADGYLARLRGPGVAEVRAGIARWHDGAVTRPDPGLATGPNAGASPGTRPPSRPALHPVIDRHLPAALNAVAKTHPGLARAIADAAPHLAWSAYHGYSVEDIGADFAANHAFASLIGEDAPVPATEFDLGLFLIAPHVLYRDHAHPAPELYAPLTGPHGWRFGPGRPLVVRPAHQPVWNDPETPHLTKVGPVPFLSLFAWTRDVNAPARVIAADDWDALAALRLAPSG